jgi:antitoxin component YwqK of YwqJK toxin-antitoxin module
MTHTKLPLFVLFLLFALPAAAEEECQFKGKEIKTTDSDALAKVTGTVRCSYRGETVVGMEYVYDHGLLKKIREFYRPSGQKKEEYGIFDPKGSPYGSDNREGSCKRWRESGSLEGEEIYEHGRLITSYRYDDSGNLTHLEMHGKSDSEKKTSVEFTAGGKIEALYCGTAFSEPKYRKLCGFEGKSKVALHSKDGKVEAYRTFLNGKLVESAELDAETGKTLASDKKAIKDADGIKSDYYPNGKVKQETRYNSENRYHGLQKEFSEEGTLVREAVFENGFMTEEHLYYQNGQPKAHTQRVRASEGGKSVVVNSQRFWDNGKRMFEGSYHELKRQTFFGLGESWSYDDLEPFGKQTSWFESGKIEIETFWDGGKKTGIWKQYDRESGSLETEKYYKNNILVRVRAFVDGQLRTDEELFPDGSRKSHTKGKGL